ncbi:glycosyltransferase family 32 protein [Neobacillus vireti]|uniref:glycosyltransferase family 32 protein n=1 Tax=Neobacillus vireti TaxID=220686 RepID=UPI002FFE750F
MIPKTIHYCWFGRGKKPDLVLRCIESWKKHCPDYQIIEWNEDNFELGSNQYVKEAYEKKKYAFVSDVARLNALNKFGGFYMDTDVELLKSLDSLLMHNCILGFEEKNYIATSFIGCEPNHQLIEKFLNQYNNISFYNFDRTVNLTTNVKRLTELLMKQGLIRDGSHQLLPNGITVFPQEYFSPYNYIDFELKKTNKTICIHHFYVSWMPWYQRIKKIIKKVTHRIKF